MKNQTNAIIGKLAAQALNRMRAAGINEGGRAHFGAFAEAKRLTKNFAAMVRSDVRAANEKREGDTVEISGAFRLVTVSPESLTFRGWAELLVWVKAVESHLKELEQRQYIAEAIPEPKVMYYRHNSEGPIYRVTEGKCYVSLLLDSGEWREVITTAEKAIARIALGEYFECDADGAPVHRDVLGLLSPESKAEQPAQPTIKPFTEATDPETGHTYRVDSHGRILVRQAGNESFYAGDCNVYVVKAVTRLGLLNAPKPAPAAEMSQRVAQSVACELLAKMETWGFDGSVGIVERLGDVVAANHLANRLRVHLYDVLNGRSTGLDINHFSAFSQIIKVHCAGWISEGHLLRNWKEAHAKLTKIAITGECPE